MTRPVCLLLALTLGLGLTGGLLLLAKPVPAQEHDAPWDLSVVGVPGGEFSLSRSDGGRFHLRDLRGRVVLLNFGFTSCPDVCPATLSRLVQLQDGLAESAGRVQVLFASFDPQRDTPGHLAAYLEHFRPELGAPFLGLSGSPQEIRAVAEQYRVRYVRLEGDSEAGYAFQHTDAVFVIDPYGRLRAAFRSDAPLEALEAEVRRHLPRVSTAGAHAEFDAEVEASVAVGGAWVRAVPPVSRHTAAYAVLRNRGDLDDWLVGASSPAARLVEIHGTERQGDVAVMKQVEALAIPAQEILALAPGGFHLMLVDLVAPLLPEDQVLLKLRFVNAGEVEVRAPVR